MRRMRLPRRGHSFSYASPPPPPPLSLSPYHNILSNPKTQSAAAFLLAFCALPVLLFSIFAVAVAATAVGGAILFALFWLALGLLVLVPTLFLAALLALLLWAWAAGTFVVGLAVYRTAVAWDARRRRAQSSQPQTPPQKPKSQSQSQTPTQTPPQHAVSLPVVADSKLGYKQPPPIPQYRPEKKATNGQGLEYTAIGRAA